MRSTATVDEQDVGLRINMEITGSKIDLVSAGPETGLLPVSGPALVKSFYPGMLGTNVSDRR